MDMWISITDELGWALDDFSFSLCSTYNDSFEHANLVSKHRSRITYSKRASGMNIILFFVWNGKFYKRMPSTATQSKKSLPARCSASPPTLRCRTGHSRSTCCRVLGSLQCRQSAVLLRAHFNILSRHFVCFSLRILLTNLSWQALASIEWLCRIQTK